MEAELSAVFQEMRSPTARRGSLKEFVKLLKDWEKALAKVANSTLQDAATRNGLEAERDRHVLAFMRTQYTDEEIERWANSEPEGVPLDDFIGELEHIVHAHQPK